MLFNLIIFKSTNDLGFNFLFLKAEKTEEKNTILVEIFVLFTDDGNLTDLIIG